MAHTYTRTVTVVPSSAEYSWTNPATGWITINQVGSSDTWEITVDDNQTNQARSATLTVNHADGTTTNSINVNQAAGNGSVTVTPTPTSPPTPTPTATSGPSIETISLGPKNSSICTATTVNTFNYTDNGIFQVGDSIPGAESDGQAIRVVTAATGSAAAQVGKVFAIQEDEIMSISDCTPVLQMTVTKGYTENNWGISSMSISPDSSGQVASSGYGLGVTGGPIVGEAGDTVVIDVNMSPNSGREWQSAGGGYVVPSATGEVTSIQSDDESHSAFFNGSTGMATYKFSFTFPSFSGNSANTTIQLEANTQATSNSGTISFGAVGDTDCGGASTTDTYSYVDNGVFVVGDSISGALPNNMGSRQVTAATGSAAAQVGKVFGFMEDEIMGISDCTPAPTPSGTNPPSSGK